MEAYDLEERVCSCGKHFKVMKTSTQAYHSAECAKDDPNYKPKVVRMPKTNLAKVISNIERGSTLAIPVNKANVDKVVAAQKSHDAELRDNPKDKWEAAIAEAKAIVGRMKESRLRIAELALSVCEVQYGGNWRAFARIYTVQNFANDVGIHPKTLHMWIRIKKNIHDQIPKDEWVEDWGLAVRVDRKVGSKPAKGKVIELYRKEKTRSEPVRKFTTVTNSLNNFLFLSQKKSVLKEVPKEDLQSALETVNALKKTITARLQELV